MKLLTGSPFPPEVPTVKSKAFISFKLSFSCGKTNDSAARALASAFDEVRKVFDIPQTVGSNSIWQCKTYVFCFEAVGIPYPFDSTGYVQVHVAFMPGFASCGWNVKKADKHEFVIPRYMWKITCHRDLPPEIDIRRSD